MEKCAYLKAQQNSLVLLDDEYARSARAVMTKRDTPKDLKPNTKDPKPNTQIPDQKHPKLKVFTNENNPRLHTTDYKPYPTDHQLQATSQNPQATY